MRPVRLFVVLVVSLVGAGLPAAPVVFADCDLRLISVNPDQVPEDADTRVVVDGCGFDLETEVVPLEGQASFVGTVPLLHSALGPGGEVLVEGGMAYVASRDFSVIDVQDPLSPVNLASLPDVSASAIARAGDLLVIMGSMLRVVDVSDPLAPAILGEVSSPCTAKHVAVSGTLVYVACDRGGGIGVFDIGEPTQPRLVGHFAPLLGTSGDNRDVAIAGSVAFFTDSSLGLVAVDISVPEHPVVLSVAPEKRSGFGLALDGHNVYVTNPLDRELLIYDVRDPSHVKLVSRISALRTVYSVAVEDGFAYVTDTGAGGLSVYDVRDPAEPLFLYVAFSPDSASIGNIEIAGGHAYIAVPSFGGGVQVFDVRTTRLPGLLSHLPTNGADSVTVRDHLAYVGGDGRFQRVPATTGLWIVDVHEPDRPRVVSKLDNISARKVVLGRSLAYLADPAFGLRVIDVEDPEDPEIVGGLDLTHMGGDEHFPGAIDLFVRKEFAYARQVSRLVIVDAREPEDLRVAGEFPISGPVAQQGAALFVGDNSTVGTQSQHVLRVLDISTPVSPEEIARLDMPGRINSIVGEGSLVVVAIEKMGMLIVDVSRRFDPVIVGSLLLPKGMRRNGRGLSVKVVGGMAYLTLFVRAHFPSDPLTGLVGLVVDLEDPGAPHIVGGNGRGFGSIFGDIEFRFLRDGLMIFRVPPPLSDALILDSRRFSLDLSSGMNRGGHDLLGFNAGSRIVLLKNAFQVVSVPRRRAPDGVDDDSDDSSDG